MFWSVGVREVRCDVTGGLRAGERAVCTALPRCYTVVWVINVVASERTSSREAAAYRSAPRSHHSALHARQRSKTSQCPTMRSHNTTTPGVLTHPEPHAPLPSPPAPYTPSTAALQWSALD